MSMYIQLLYITEAQDCGLTIMKEIKFYVRHCFKDVKPSTWRSGTEENEKNKMCAKNKEEHQ